MNRFLCAWRCRDADGRLRLWAVGNGMAVPGAPSPTLVGRRWEMSAVEGLLDRAIEGHGAVVGVVGPPGMG